MAGLTGAGGMPDGAPSQNQTQDIGQFPGRRIRRHRACRAQCQLSQFFFDLAFDELAVVTSIPPAAVPTTFAVLWESTLNTYRTMAVPDLQAAIGAGIPVLRSYLAGLALSTAGSSATFGIAPVPRSRQQQCHDDGAQCGDQQDHGSVGGWKRKRRAGYRDHTRPPPGQYHVFLIWRSDTGVADVLVSLSATAPALPASYTQFRPHRLVMLTAASRCAGRHVQSKR